MDYNEQIFITSIKANMQYTIYPVVLKKREMVIKL